MNRTFAWRRGKLIAVALLMVLCVQSLASACPTCKDALAANDPLRQNLVRGYGWSIIFMMSMPFLIFSCLTSYFYYLVVMDRRKKAKLLAAKVASEQADREVSRPADAEQELVGV